MRVLISSPVAPALVALAATYFAGEWLNRWETVGLVLVSAGIASVAFGLMKEGSGPRRIAAAAIVVAGNLLLQIF